MTTNPTTLIAPLVDIAEALTRFVYPGDSRDRYGLYLDWAAEFDASFKTRAEAGSEPGETYYEDVDAFAVAKAKAHGFAAADTFVNGKAYTEGQLVAAVRCSEELFEAYARADEANGGGSRSIDWSSLDYAKELSCTALSAADRDEINERCARDNGIGIETSEHP